MPHVRIRPNRTRCQYSLCVFELDFESVGIDVLRPLVQLPGRCDGEDSAVEQSVKWCLGDVVAASDVWTTSGLAHQLPHRMEEVDVVAGQVVDPFERGQGWPLQSVVANQTADHGPVFLLNLSEFRDYADS